MPTWAASLKPSYPTKSERLTPGPTVLAPQTRHKHVPDFKPPRPASCRRAARWQTTTSSRPSS
ncbi:hypothetical protein Bpfe_021723, partial [Biomphalaria pfeifferi]